MRRLTFIVPFLVISVILTTKSTYSAEHHMDYEYEISDGSPWAEHVPHKRQKRNFLFPGWTQDTQKASLTDAEREVILSSHNDYRRLEEASDMRTLRWNNSLETVAQAWANGCDFDHNYSNRYGENLSSQTRFYNVSEMVRGWHSEKEHYTYETHNCEGVCGHYIQVVLAESSSIGCGIKYCPTMTTISQSMAYFLVCNYNPAENKGSSVPYQSGTRCSSCPSDMPTCNDNLCDIATDQNPTTSVRPTVTVASTPTTKETRRTSEGTTLTTTIVTERTTPSTTSTPTTKETRATSEGTTLTTAIVTDRTTHSTTSSLSATVNITDTTNTTIKNSVAMNKSRLLYLLSFTLMLVLIPQFCKLT